MTQISVHKYLWGHRSAENLSLNACHRFQAWKNKSMRSYRIIKRQNTGQHKLQPNNLMSSWVLPASSSLPCSLQLLLITTTASILFCGQKWTERLKDIFFCSTAFSDWGKQSTDSSCAAHLDTADTITT